MPGMNARRNVFLIGPMGAGKSTIGRHLASLLKKEFVDSDTEIEARTGVRIPVIFEIEGEDGFRRREVQVVDELSQRDNLVLATGGGVVLNAANRAALSERGTVVYLRTQIDVLWERTRRDRNRPLLQTANPRATLAELMENRAPLYESIADLIIDTDQRSPSAVARDVAAKVKKAWEDENSLS